MNIFATFRWKCNYSRIELPCSLHLYCKLAVFPTAKWHLEIWVQLYLFEPKKWSRERLRLHKPCKRICPAGIVQNSSCREQKQTTWSGRNACWYMEVLLAQLCENLAFPVNIAYTEDLLHQLTTITGINTDWTST